MVMLKLKNIGILILLVSAVVIFSSCDRKETTFVLGILDPYKIYFNERSSSYPIDSKSLNQVLRTAVYVNTHTIEGDCWETLRFVYPTGEVLYIGFSYLDDKMYALWDNNRYTVEQYGELYRFLCQYMDKDEYRPISILHGSVDPTILEDGNKVYTKGRYYQKRYFYNNNNQNPNYRLGHTLVKNITDSMNSRVDASEEDLARAAAQICGLENFCAFTFKDPYTGYTLIEMYARVVENGKSMADGESIYIVFNELGRCLYILDL